MVSRRNGVQACLLAALFCAASVSAQNPPSSSLRPARAAQAKTPASSDYASDILVVRDAQEEVLKQAEEMLQKAENLRERDALETAIKEMERSQTALDQSKKSPEKLPAAIAAQQAAYQALLKLIPREHRVSESQSRGKGGGRQSNEKQLDQLEMKQEENRYETERQAKAATTPEQREKLETADRLKELAQRQQDLNERLQELQNALQAAQTEQEREEIKRQLKRLRDEERNMLADVDELRQKLEQSPNVSSSAETRQQLEQTRSDMQRAAEQMEKESASQALAAGTRAQQAMQNLRDNLRKETSSQFSDQMRELRNEARDLAKQQEEIAKGLDALENGKQKSLDNAAERKELGEQMSQQKRGLTNLLSGMRAVTEQAENSEPLLYNQLYDTLRRADQAHTENLLDMGAQMTQRGFIPQASEVERSARTNINQLRQGVERAAESVLGNEADALRYAQKELDELAQQMEREISGSGSNAQAKSAGAAGTNQTNQAARALGRDGETRSGREGGKPGAQAKSPAGEGEPQSAGANPQGGQKGDSPGREGQDGGRGEQASAQESQKGEGAPSGNNPGSEGEGQGNQPRQASQGNSPGGQSGSGAQGSSEQAQSGEGQGVGNSESDRLREFTQQLGRGGSGGSGGSEGTRGGPITGGGFAEWSDRMRDVERALDPADLRNQLATVRERVSAFRSEFRERGQAPPPGRLEEQVLAPMTQVRVWLQQELARKENANSLVPLDRDPVPDKYSELVRQYYEKLGSAQ